STRCPSMRARSRRAAPSSVPWPHNAPEIGVEHPGRAPGLVGQAHAVLDVRGHAAHEHTPRADAGPRPARARPILGSHDAVGATWGVPRPWLWSAGSV